MRVQLNIVAVQERRLLNWFCARVPDAISPNYLSAVGVFGALVVFVGYAASTLEPNFLWLASLGFVLNWFGDSMDGSLARARATERPVFGHFFDHSLDAFGNSVMMLGLGVSLHVRMDVAVATLAGYLLMTIHVLLKQQAQGVFQLSFLAFGPTELRLCLVAMTVSMWLWGSHRYPIAGIGFTPYDMILSFAAFVFSVLFVVETARTSRQLALVDPPRRPNRPAGPT